MSYRTYTQIAFTCDGCGRSATAKEAGHSTKPATVRRNLKTNGWVVTRPNGYLRDICPTCKDKSEA